MPSRGASTPWVELALRLLKVTVGVALLWPIQVGGWPLASGSWVVLHGALLLLRRRAGGGARGRAEERGARLVALEEGLDLLLLGAALAAAAALDVGLVHHLLCAGLLALMGLSLVEEEGFRST